VVPLFRDSSRLESPYHHLLELSGYALVVNKMASILNSALTSMTSWMGAEEESTDYTFYCDCERLIELIVEKAREKNDCVDIEQKQDEGQLQVSPRHKKCPTPSLLKTSKVQPTLDEENFLTERLLRDRAESGELGIRVGDGVLSLQLITDAKEGAELLIKRVDDASPATLRMLSEIPQYSSTILAICFDATKEDLDKLESAVKGQAFCWKIGSVGPGENSEGDKQDDDEMGSRKECLSDQDFEAFVAIARATLVLHVIQQSGL